MAHRAPYFCIISKCYNVNELSIMNKRKHTFAYGDKIYAILCINGQKIVEFTMDTISDITQLIGQIRQTAYKYGGLAQLYVRNITRGWSMNRPLMLYNDIYRKVAARIPRDNASIASLRLS